VEKIFGSIILIVFVFLIIAIPVGLLIFLISKLFRKSSNFGKRVNKKINRELDK
jgi:hypothetical protein